MSNDVYPSLVKGLTWTVLKTPDFSTIVQRSPGMVELRIAQSQNPIWTFQLIYEYLYDNFGSANNTKAYSPQTDLRTLMGFFLKHQGKYDDFLFDDPSDDYVGAQTWRARFDFNPNTTIIDSAGHAQLTVQGGLTASTIPTFNHSGGSVQDGQVLWADQGLLAGSSGQTLSLVSNSTNPVSVATVASGGTGFAVGDYLSVTGGGGTGAVLQVATESGGVIQTFTIISGGSGYTTTSAAALSVLTGSGGSSPTANITAVTIYYTPLQRNMGGEFLEDVTDLNTSVNPLRVWANGVAQTLGTCGVGGATGELLGPGLTIPGNSYSGMYIQWCSQPTTPITACFNFYFRVRFAADKQDFEQFMQELWTIGGGDSKNGSGTLELTSSRTAGI